MYALFEVASLPTFSPFFFAVSLVTAVTTFAPLLLLRDLDKERLAFEDFRGSAFNGSPWLVFEGLRPGESVRCDRLRDLALLSFEGLRCGLDRLRRAFWLAFEELQRGDRGSATLTFERL